MVTFTWKYVIRPSLIFAKCFMIAFLTLSVMMSGLTCYDCVIGDKPVPEFEPITKKLKEVADRKIRKEEIPRGKACERWHALADTMVILKDINPTVAAWLQEHYDSGKLIFNYPEGTEIKDLNSFSGNHSVGVLCKYDYLTGKVYINAPFFSEKHARRAALICHEYRHSRQNFGKYFRYIFSHAFMEGGKEDIIESDAYFYEAEAEKAIYGERGSSNGDGYDTPYNTSTKHPRP